jgi:hypothetical protein
LSRRSFISFIGEGGSSAVGAGDWSYAGKTSMGGALQRRVNISNGLRLALYIPQTQVFQDLFNHIRVLYKRNYSHFRRTFRTQKWINFPPKNGGQAPIFCINPPAGKSRPVFRKALFLVSTVGETENMPVENSLYYLLTKPLTVQPS